MPILSPPKEIVKMTRVLEDAGHEAWCVGGAVRDAFLGIQNLDWDLATSATPHEVRKLFKRTIPVGIEFGTIGVLDDNRVMHEVTTFRQDVETDGRHAVVKFGVSLEDDLSRRDFTINAIAYSPIRDEVRDPFNGQKDIESGILRAVGRPLARMEEDRLRALRAIRFASRFGFEIEAETWTAILESAPYLTRLSAERVKQEIEKTMEQVVCPSNAFKLWRASGALKTLLPALEKVKMVQLRAIDFLPQPGLRTRPQRKLLRLAAFFYPAHGGKGKDRLKYSNAKHDGTLLATLTGLRFSKADTTWIADIIEFLHGDYGKQMKASLMEQSRNSSQDRSHDGENDRVSGSVHNVVNGGVYDRVYDGVSDSTAENRSPQVSDVMIRHWASDIGRTKLDSAFRVANAIWHAEREAGMAAPDPKVVKSVYRRAIRIAYRDPVSVADLAVNGTDLQEVGIQGRKLGQVLRRLLNDVIEDPSLNSRDILLKRAIQS